MEDLQSRLAQFGQGQVLRFWDQLSEAGRRQLREQLESVDLAEIARLWSAEEAAVDWKAISARAEPPPAVRLADWQSAPRQREAARKAGESALREGKVGMVLVAGGQGSRLGFEHPKGMFPIGPLSGHSLFQILLERLHAVARRHACRIPLYVMTSPATHEATLAYLHENRRFGLPADDLRIFCQGTMPAVDAASGRLLLAERDSLFLSPDGHGGMLRALQRSGLLEEMRGRGLQTLFYGQIDNPLLQVCDPLLLGAHRLHQAEITTQVVARTAPEEPVGNVVQVDGQVRIIEYIHLSPEAAARRDSAGRLALWAGNLAVHVFEIDFLARQAAQGDALPFHRAHKKVPFLDAAGNRHEPAEPNAYKFEQFIFDLLPHATRPLVVEAEAAEAFAPVKNAEGAERDTPTLARQAMMRRDRRRLRAIGVAIGEETPVEIGPLFALGEAELRSRLEEGCLPTAITEPTYFSE